MSRESAFCFFIFPLLLLPCGKPQAPDSSVKGAASVRPFIESLPEATELPQWVEEAFPSDTMIVDYYREGAWDGSRARFWILNSSTGFGSLKQSTDNRECFDSAI